MTPHPPSRRDFLGNAATGLGGIAFASLLAEENRLGAESPHHAPKATRAIQIFLGGALSQVDSFDYKPELEKQHGKSMPNYDGVDVFNNKLGLLHRSHYKFRQRGESGLWVSELFPEIAELADELTVIKSMFAETGNHIPAAFQANAGFRQVGFPTMGAWLSYGLGRISEDLPTYVVLPDARGLPHGEANNWTNGFLPARHQGVVFRTKGDPIRDLTSAELVSDNTQSARLDLLRGMNLRHAADRDNPDALISRVRSYELAARMQTAVPGVADLSGETEETKKLYGFDRKECADFARGCLLGRRLLERDVRFVQLWSGTGISWDAHDDITGGKHAGEAKRIDRPVAGLLRDLKRRGMLDDTLVIFSTEFGRTPFAQASKGKLNKGRDHNQTAYTNWLAGAGLKPGIDYGATDEFGYKSVEKPVSIYDFHATILHLLGIDHEALTFYHNGIQRRLTNVHGHVIDEILG